MTTRLYERTAEIAAIDAALARLAEGRGSSLLLEARAGRGKSTLVEYAVEQAREQGARTLGARARHLASAAPFEVLRRLLGPAVEQAGGVEALGGAAKFAGPLFTPGADLSHGVDYGCQWLIAWLAERDPLLLAVDDAHWADAASLRVLLDVQAEISAQRVALVVASRPVENPEVQGLLAAMAAHPDCEVLSPETLSRAAVEELASERLGGPAADDFVAECLQVSRGNPFYVTELLRSFEPGARLDPQALRLDGTLSLQRTMSWRLGELGPAAAALAQAAAVLGDGCSLRYAAELAQLGEAVATGEAARLEVASVFAHGDPVEFLHPLLRAAVEAELPEVMAGELHARAARILWSAGEDSGAVAQHLLASPGSGDAAVSAYLREQGEVALETGSVALARRLLQRALDEPAPSDQRDGILLALGRAEHLASELGTARGHLETAMASPDRDVALAAAGELLDVLMDDGRYDEVGSVHERALALRPFGDTEAEVFVRMTLYWLVVMDVVPGLGDLPPELSGVDASALPTDRDVDRHCLVYAAIYERSRPGGTTERLTAQLRRALACLPLSPDDLTATDVRTATDAAPFLGEHDLDEAGKVLERVAPAAARFAGARPQLQAELEHRRIQNAITVGSFEDALAMIDAAEEFSVRHGLVAILGWHRFSRARIALERGDYAFAGTLLRERTADDLVAPALGAVLNGEPAVAVAMLDSLELSAEVGAPLRQIEVEFQPHLVASHAYEYLGDRDRAAAEAARELEIRRRYGPVPSLAEALRRASSFAPVRQGIGMLEEAVALADSTPRRPVQSRMLASYGAALRQVGRIPEAREVLSRAADLAADMGMERRLQQVRQELLLAGSRPRRARATGPTSLTDAQREVAVLAAEGLTNRQIAERLFVTIKTVETHLMAVYRKLGIKGRDQLAEAMEATLEERLAQVVQTGP